MKLNLDFIDLAIFDFIHKYAFSNACEKKEIGGKVYYWISPKLIITELPYVGITTTQNINKRIDNLIREGLLCRCPENQSQRKTFIGVGDRYNEFMGYEVEKEDDNFNANIQVTSTQTFNYHNTNNQVKENISKDISKKFDLDAEIPFDNEELKGILTELLTYPNWQKKTPHAKHLRMLSLKRIAGSDVNKAIASAKWTLQKGWDDFYEPKDYKPQPVEQPKQIDTRPRWQQLGYPSEEAYNEWMKK